MYKLLATIALGSTLLFGASNVAMAIDLPIQAQSTNSLDVQGLTPSQINDLQILVLKQKKESLSTDTISLPNASQVNEYAEFGKKYTSAILEMAKGLGQTVNEFMNTPAGHWALFFIAWKIFGATMLSTIVGLLWFISMYTLWGISFKKVVIAARDNYNAVLNKAVEDKNYTRDVDAVSSKMLDQYVIWSVTHVIALIIITIIGAFLI